MLFSKVSAECAVICIVYFEAILHTTLSSQDLQGERANYKKILSTICWRGQFLSIDSWIVFTSGDPNRKVLIPSFLYKYLVVVCTGFPSLASTEGKEMYQNHFLYMCISV